MIRFYDGQLFVQLVLRLDATHETYSQTTPFLVNVSVFSAAVFLIRSGDACSAHDELHVCALHDFEHAFHD